MTSPLRAVPLTPAQSDLADRHVSWALGLTRGSRAAHRRLADEIRSGTLFALVRAAQAYDPGRRDGASFATYARIKILGALADLLRRDRRDPVGYRDGDELAGRAFAAATPPPDPSEAAASADQVEHWLGRLPAAEADACRAVWVGGSTQADYVARAGSSKGAISQKLRVARGRLARMPDVLEAAGRRSA